MRTSSVILPEKDVCINPQALRTQAQEILYSTLFYVFPIVCLGKGAFVMIDNVTDILVVWNLWRCGNICRPWSICGMVILATSAAFSAYRIAYLSLERQTFAVMGLHTKRFLILRILLTCLQIHHIIYV